MLDTTDVREQWRCDALEMVSLSSNVFRIIQLSLESQDFFEKYNNAFLG